MLLGCCFPLCAGNFSGKGREGATNLQRTVAGNKVSKMVFARLTVHPHPHAPFRSPDTLARDSQLQYQTNASMHDPRPFPHTAGCDNGHSIANCISQHLRAVERMAVFLMRQLPFGHGALSVPTSALVRLRLFV